MEKIETVEVTFLEDVSVEDAVQERIEGVNEFRRGETYPLAKASAARWERRGKALDPERAEVYFAESEERAALAAAEREDQRAKYLASLEGLQNELHEANEQAEVWQGRYRVLYTAVALVTGDDAVRDYTDAGAVAAALSEAVLALQSGEPGPGANNDGKAAPDAAGDGPGVQSALGQLQAAIGEMLTADPEKKDSALWTNDGKPDTRALGDLVGRKVSAQERDEAWASLQGGHTE